MVTVLAYERALHYRRGVFTEVLQPGRHRMWGPGHRVVPVDIRLQSLDIRPQQVPTADGVDVKASATLQWSVGEHGGTVVVERPS